MCCERAPSTPTQACRIRRALSLLHHTVYTLILRVKAKGFFLFVLISFQLVFHCHECSIQNDFCDRNFYFASIHLLLGMFWNETREATTAPECRSRISLWISYSKLASRVRQAQHYQPWIQQGGHESSFWDWAEGSGYGDGRVELGCREKIDICS